MPHRSTAPKSLPTPLHAAVVMSLTVFFLGLVLWRPPAAQHVASVQIRAMRVGPADRHGAAGACELPSVRPQQIANAVRAADRQMGRCDSQRPLPPAELRELASRIEVRACEPIDGAAVVQLSFRGQDPQWSVALVHQLAQQMLVGESRGDDSAVQDDEELRAAKWNVDLARHYERKARYDMEGALRAQLPRPDGVREPSQVAGSPAWSTYQESEEGVDSDGGLRQATFAAPAAAEDGSEGSATYQRQRALYEQTVAQRERAEMALEQLLLRQHEDAPRAVPLLWSMVAPALVVGRVGGEMSSDTVAAIGFLALACGVFVFWRTHVLGGLEEVDSVADLYATLSLPVVGRVSIDPPVRSRWRRESWARLIRWSFRTSELLLIAMFVLFLASAVSDSTVAGQFLDDPLGTFARRVAVCVGR